MSQFSYRGSPNLQCPVTLSAALASSSPSPGSVSILNVSTALLPPSSASSSSSAVSGISSGTIAGRGGGGIGGGGGGGNGGGGGGENHSLGSSTLSNSRMAVTSAVIRPPGSPASSVSPSQTHGPPTAGAGPPNTGRCCDTGRPIFTDPVTGQSICSCQYELLGAGYQRLGGITPAALSMYSTPYAAAAAAVASEGIAAYFPSLGAEQSPFYSPTAAGLDLKENLGAGAGAAWPYPTVYHPYDAAAFASYPFNGYGVDLNHARRKNATRETTSTLKAWLNEHKKNPYPTKGEKIMLAIITKMTLTQVSTWFANARRRLKKENKMTWEPRNRVEDEDNNNDDDDSGRKSVDEKDRLDSKDSGTGSSEDGERPVNRLDLLHGPGVATGNLQGRMESEWNESRADSGPDSPECLYDQREPARHPLQLQHPAYLSASHNRLLRHSSPESTSPSGGGGPSIHLPTTTTTITTSSSTTASGETGIKPRIWSLADMANKQDGDQPNSNSNTNPTISGLGSPYSGLSGACGTNAPGKIVNPLASRLPPHHPLHPAMHSGSQYVRPHPDFYRNFYGASHLGSQDMAFLETYSRTLGGLAMPPTSVPNMLTVTSPSTSSASNNIKSFSLNGNGNGPPVLLTTTSSGVSPSASSTTSSNGSDQRSPHPNDVNNHPSTEIQSPSRV